MNRSSLPARAPWRRWLALTLVSAAGFESFSNAHAEWSWIWASQNGADAAAVLRREFEVPGNLKEASLIVTCDNGARVRLNGVEVVVNEDWSEPSKADVASKLKAGKNEIVAEATNKGGPAGFVARLRWVTADGKSGTLETDGSWTAGLSRNGDWKPAKVVGKYGEDPWGDPFGVGATGGIAASKPLVPTPEELQALPGFKVELLHVVPKADEGSWVSMTVDPKGRLIACDQYGSLYRVTPSPVGSGAPAKVERLTNKIGGAHGLLYAFDSLYVMVNEQNGKQGLWRLRDTNGDDQFDQEQLLRRIQGGGEHGPHAIVLAPDGKSLYVVCGNHTRLPDHLELSRAARSWDEDQIVERLWDANGHARGILAPGGYICKTDPDGKVFELISYGYRNSYDIAFNALGDLFTYDSDMEWDAGSPWYRPTRICMAASGSDLGWRSGAGKWPSYYPDSLPAVQDIGPGSPTGVVSGQGAKFPARYQQAIFAADWTYGTLYAVHLTPSGGAYQSQREEFLSGKPFPLTDLVVHPQDGSLYVAIGGRKTQSALYRVSYVGTESTAPAPALQPTAEITLRHELETLHDHHVGYEALDKAWPLLAHADRFVRYAARVAVERQSHEQWLDRARSESRPWAVIESSVALARVGPKSHAGEIVGRLNKLDFASLDSAAQLALIRAYQLVVTRQSPLDAGVRSQMIARLDALFPAKTRDLNRELAGALIALEAPTAVAKTVQLMMTARDEDVTYASDALLARNSGYADAFNKASTSRPNQQQIAYAYELRTARSGWTPASRRAFFGWFPRTAPWLGGNSFRGFLENIRKDALANVQDPAERQALDTLSTKKLVAENTEEFPPPKGPGKNYSLDELVGLAGAPLRGRNFDNGRVLFHSAACFSCHRFNGSGGGLGPDLTGSAGRFSVRDLLENIVEPSKVISDQYGSEQIELTDGSSVIGRAYDDNGKLVVVSDPRNPDEKEVVDPAKVKSRKPYPVSMMPAGLLNGLNHEEILNLLAYIQSAGDPKHPAFARP